ncbi:hypothetical protein [Idiomarina aminovorans]|uniref:hypothetical protein n=1 Tax=Idiomarina aminovorans TaxID=2914829 RepID=UPI002004F65B|nr:hypothetical protein [Idiomarina sp. ATCH4]MCK7460542.1 hypothetical protein [Idiomarina sp. ATCH4]
MYFWDIDALKSDFLQGRFSQTQSFYYLLVMLVLFTLPIGIVGDNTTVWDKAFFWVELVFVILGTTVAYKANGGRDGIEFLERYVSLSWVLFIRIIPFLILLVIAASIFREIFMSDAGYQFTAYDFSAFVLIGIIYYWRLSHHMAELNQAKFSGVEVNTNV